jgi:N-acetylglucosamine kinase-like BadF-type ATPase
LTVPAHFGLRSPAALTAALHAGRLSEGRIGELSPVIFEAAVRGDPVARSIADRMADEVAAMAGALLGRLRLKRADPDVVLGGGVMRVDDAVFHARIRAGIAATSPRADVIRLSGPPVAGAALLGIDALDPTAASAVGSTVRSDLAAWDRTRRA